MKDDRVYLGHIRDAIHDIEEYTARGRDAFMSERMRQDAVIRKFEVIGEAVKHLSEETTKRRPDMPWKRIAGMRDRLTHDYLGVDTYNEAGCKADDIRPTSNATPPWSGSRTSQGRSNHPARPRLHFRPDLVPFAMADRVHQIRRFRQLRSDHEQL